MENPAICCFFWLKKVSNLQTCEISEVHYRLKGHVKTKFQYFLNPHSNVYLEKDERQALRTRKHYMLICFWIILWVYSWDIHVWKVVNAEIYLPTVRFLFNKINSHDVIGKRRTSSAPYMLILYLDFFWTILLVFSWDIHVWKLSRSFTSP